MDFGKNLRQIYAFIAKELKLELRYKEKFILKFFSPLWSFVMPMIIFGKLFQITEGDPIGIWTPENFLFFILTGFCVGLLKRFLNHYQQMVRMEKFYKTLPAIFLSPSKQSVFFLGLFLTESLLLSIPISVVFFFLFLLFPTSILSFLIAICVFIAGGLFVASLGLFLAAITLTKEGLVRWLIFLLNIFLIFSCINYPREIFPDFLEYLIIINPFYYFWDLYRAIWLFGIENIIFNPSYVFHIILIIVLSIITPFISFNSFNYLYKKYGIAGY